LAALLHGTLAVGVSQTVALNRGRYLHSAGRPSRWALAHISSSVLFFLQYLFWALATPRPAIAADAWLVPPVHDREL